MTMGLQAAVGRSLAMLIRQKMTHEVVSITPGTSLLKSKSLLRDLNIRHLPVVDKDDHVVGLLYAEDIKAFSPQQTTGLEVLELLDILDETPAKQIMQVAPPTINIDDTVENAALLMVEKRVGCLPVVNNDDKLVGIVTEWDIFKTFIDITGSRTEGVQMAFVLENKPGTLRVILARLKEAGASVVTVLSAIREDGFRDVTLRFRGERAIEEALIKEFCAQGTVQYWGRKNEIHIVGGNS